MNKNSFKKKLLFILSPFKINPKNIDTYFMAFTHPSYANEENLPNNERLEFLGDAILEFLVTDFLYKTYPNSTEGELSKLRAKFVCTQANAEYAIQLNLTAALLLGRGEKEHGGIEKESVQANVFEAFLGAVYLEEGLAQVNSILEKIVYPKILNPNVEFFSDYKSRLQEYVQAESRRGVEYILEKEEGPSHQKTFTVSVYHDKIKLGTGIGKSKKSAEQAAAEDAISKMAIK